MHFDDIRVKYIPYEEIKLIDHIAETEFSIVLNYFNNFIILIYF